MTRNIDNKQENLSPIDQSLLEEGTIQFDGRTYPDGRASDPRVLGWMQGSPPPADKRITFESNRFFDFPESRWSLSHMRELMPTVNVWRGRGGHSPLERSDRAAEIDGLTFVDTDGRIRRFDEALLDTYTDGIVVLHRGRIVYERYFGALEPHMQHDCQSITKSYVGTLTASLVQEGVLDDSKTIGHYLPEMLGTAWEDATLRHVMDMQTGLAFDEDYPEDRPSSLGYVRAAGRRPRPAGYDGPPTAYDYLLTVRKEGAHGEAFTYKSLNPEVLAWVLARVTGCSLAELLHKRLWAPLGCEEDAYISIDQAGMPLASGGLCLSLRDLARFGELMRRKGEWNGEQLIPAAVVNDLQSGDHPAKPEIPSGYSYRSQWWVSHNELGAFEGLGRFGQLLHVAPAAEMVVARFASQPADVSEPITRPQMLALGQMLRSQGSSD